MVLLARAANVRYGLVYALLGAAIWVALFDSGVDPVAVGLVMGLLTYAYAYAPARGDLEQATGLFRLFREQPTPELARSALRSARPSRAEKKPHTKTTRVTSATAAASRFASLPTG